jgi:hypothetical protein
MYRRKMIHRLSAQVTPTFARFWAELGANELAG